MEVSLWPLYYTFVVEMISCILQMILRLYQIKCYDMKGSGHVSTVVDKWKTEKFWRTAVNSLHCLILFCFAEHSSMWFIFCYCSLFPFCYSIMFHSIVIFFARSLGREWWFLLWCPSHRHLHCPSTYSVHGWSDSIVCIPQLGGRGHWEPPWLQETSWLVHEVQDRPQLTCTSVCN